jgi:hypothetical protein
VERWASFCARLITPPGAATEVTPRRRLALGARPRRRSLLTWCSPPALGASGAGLSTTCSASRQPGWIGATYVGWSAPSPSAESGGTGSVVF